MGKFENNPMLEKIKSLEILQFLKDGPEEFAAIFRIEFEDRTAKVEDFIDDDILELQILDREKEGAYIYYIKSKPMSHPSVQFDPLAAGGYFSVPFEIRDRRARMSYLGSAKQVKTFLEGVEKTGVKYRVARISDAKFPQNSPLSRLTEKQRRVLVAAYRLGYYDEPRRISSQELAKRMKVGSSTLINHRRRAERRLLAELVGR
jgi:DNA-binding CsgD family transcriptional regulator